MKRIIATILIFLIGLGFVLYPVISNKLNEINGSKAIQNFDNIVNSESKEDITEDYQQAKDYNDSLVGQKISDPFVPGSGIVIPDNYYEILNYSNNMMGYIEIPKIEVELPIYHGVAEETLSKGVGHMSESAFPIGGEGYHSILTGHTGLTSAKLFTDLTELEEGDLFYIHILNEIHAYKIDQINIVEPSDTALLMPIQNKDYITLVTCTPYGINTHRLLVRGERTEYNEEEKNNIKPVKVSDIDKYSYKTVTICALTMVGIIIVIAIPIKIYNRRKEKREEQN